MLTTMRSPGSALRAASTICSQSWPPTTRTVSVSLIFRLFPSSVVAPPLVGRGYLRALVFDRDAAEWIVLALRMPLPVVGHLDSGQRWMAVEDDPEEVVGLALVPVVGRVDPIQRRDMRITVRRRHFQPEPAVVGDRLQRVHGVQFPAGLVRVMHPVDAQAQLEAQFRLVAKTLRD